MYKMFICEYRLMYFAIVASNNNLPLVKQKKKENYQKQKKV